MKSFSGYITDEGLIQEIEESYGTVENFLMEAASNIVDPVKYSLANKVAQHKSDEDTNNAKEEIKKHLSNYGRSLDDDDELKHLDDKELFSDREKHLKHLKSVYDNDPDPKKKKYRQIVAAAKKRLPIKPHGQNRKTATMKGESVMGHEVVASVSNIGMAASVNKIGKNGKVQKTSTCVNSKQSCRGEGPNNIGAPCLGRTGCSAYPGVKKARITLENMKTMKAHAKNGHHYGYNGEEGKPVQASPHLDYATLEHASLTDATEHAKEKSEETGKRKLAVYRQNTTNEQSAMHHDQVMHHLPDDLKHHLATNNYSATIAKSHYDPNNPSDRSTHDGRLHNTNFSVKGPEVAHDDKGKVVGTNKSSNVQETAKALHPEHDEHGNITRPAQNAYMVAGGHYEGQRLRYPKGKKTGEVDENGEPKTTKSFHISQKPKYFTPFEKLNKVKTARIYGKEKELKPGEAKHFHHPDGWGHETHYDENHPNPDGTTGKERTFEYQDHHVHVNAPKPDEHGHVDFGTLNDNVGADERKPKEHEIKRSKVINPQTKKGYEVGAIHISAATASTSNDGADGVHKTNKSGERVGGKHGVSNDPFTFPIQHHIDKDEESRINLNHPKQQFEAEHQDRENKKKTLPMAGYQEHPKTKAERGELK